MIMCAQKIENIVRIRMTEQTARCCSQANILILNRCLALSVFLVLVKIFIFVLFFSPRSSFSQFLSHCQIFIFLFFSFDFLNSVVTRPFKNINWPFFFFNLNRHRRVAINLYFRRKEFYWNCAKFFFESCHHNY